MFIVLADFVWSMKGLAQTLLNLSIAFCITVYSRVSRFDTQVAMQYLNTKLE